MDKFRRKVRLIGGACAGQTLWWDLAQGDTINVPKHTDFAMYDPGAIDLAEAVIHYEVYRVAEIKMHGHSHVYGFPAASTLAHALNEMWYEYQRSKNNG